MGVAAPPRALIPGPDTWWPDLLEPYIKSTNLIACPNVRTGYGIAIQHPQLSSWASDQTKMQVIKKPSETVPFADSGYIINTIAKPDNWVEQRIRRSSIGGRP